MLRRHIQARASALLVVFATQMVMSCSLPSATGSGGDPGWELHGVEGASITETVTAVTDGVVSSEVQRHREVGGADLLGDRTVTALPAVLPILDVGKARVVHSTQPTPAGPMDVTLHLGARGEYYSLEGSIHGQQVLQVDMDWVEAGGQWHLVREAQHYFRDGQYIARKVTSLAPSEGLLARLGTPSTAWTATAATGHPIATPRPFASMQEEDPGDGGDYGGCCGFKIAKIVVEALALGIFATGAILGCLLSLFPPATAIVIGACLMLSGLTAADTAALSHAIDEYQECMAGCSSAFLRFREEHDPSSPGRRLAGWLDPMVV